MKNCQEVVQSIRLNDKLEYEVILQHEGNTTKEIHNTSKPLLDIAYESLIKLIDSDSIDCKRLIVFTNSREFSKNFQELSVKENKTSTNYLKLKRSTLNKALILKVACKKF